MRKKRNLFFGILLMIALLAACGQADNISETGISLEERPIPTASSETIPSKSVEELSPSNEPEEKPSAILPAPGIHSTENLLRTALLPVGNTMYIWGGGWNEEDTGAGIEAVSFGVSNRWKEFADLQTSEYDMKNHRYQIHDGLDCSGYVGWVIYNVMETEEGKDGYVTKSTETSAHLSDLGLGDFYDKDSSKEYLCGDIVSMSGHVWISLGTCSDGSVLLLHSSPPGVRISGTKLSDGSTSEAVKLAEKTMKTYYPNWYEKYPSCGVNAAYLKDTSLLRFTDEVFPDASTYHTLSPEQVLKKLFEE